MKMFFLLIFSSIFIILILNTVIYQDIPYANKNKLVLDIQKAKKKINSIDFNAKDSSDLKILDSILKGNRILMLGENQHNDGETFKAKSRIIKYLHENLDYNVVLYEAGQYDCSLMNNEMKINGLKTPKDSIGGVGLFNFWWANNETKPLIEYYLKSKSSTTPIEIGGFDIQFSGSLLSGQKRSELLKKFLTKNNIDINNYPILNKNLKNITYLSYDWYANKKLSNSQKKTLLNEIIQLVDLISSFDVTEENILYSRYLKDIKNNFYKSWNYKTGSMKSMNFRDSLMAQNLIYQIDSIYKDQKVIVWCANIHTFFEKYNEDYFPLGSYIKNKYGKNSYMMAFSSYGKYNNRKEIIEKPSKFAIENSFHETNTPYFIINLRNIGEKSLLKNKFFSTINQGIDQEKKWSDFIDGIFYIDINKNPTY